MPGSAVVEERYQAHQLGDCPLDCARDRLVGHGAEFGEICKQDGDGAVCQPSFDCLPGQALRTGFTERMVRSSACHTGSAWIRLPISAASALAWALKKPIASARLARAVGSAALCRRCFWTDRSALT
ncbi:hypothetical protein [Sphingomonas sp.]|uniref:hypothetical protein n=1 Tax=Sphingomonas sp. TaxID=28214 RepID=UPI0035BC4799